MPASSASGTGATVQGTSGTVANHLGASASAAATTRRGMFQHLLAAAVPQGGVGHSLEDLADVRRAEEGGARRDHLVEHIVDDLVSHGMELIGRIAHGRVLEGQGSVHRFAIGQVAEARVLVVAGARQHRCAQHIPVGNQGSARVVVDGRGDRSGEGRVGIGPDQAADGGILHHQVELGDRRFDEPRHRGPALARALLVTMRHRGEHVREPA